MKRSLIVFLLICLACMSYGQVLTGKIEHPRKYLFGIKWRMFLLPRKTEEIKIDLKNGDQVKRLGSMDLYFRKENDSVIFEMMKDGTNWLQYKDSKVDWKISNWNLQGYRLNFIVEK